MEVKESLRGREGNGGGRGKRERGEREGER